MKPSLTDAESDGWGAAKRGRRGYGPTVRLKEVDLHVLTGSINPMSRCGNEIEEQDVSDHHLRV